MRLTTVSIQRPEGTVIATGISVQIDQASPKEVVEQRDIGNYRGADLFRCDTLWWPSVLIRRQDVLIDERYVDEETGAAYKYRVTGRPKLYDLDHVECYLEVVVGG